MHEPINNHSAVVVKDALIILVRGYIIGDTTSTSVALARRTDHEVTVITRYLGPLWNLAQQHANANGVENSSIAHLTNASDQVRFAPVQHRAEIERVAAAVLDPTVHIDDLLTTTAPIIRAHVIATWIATLLVLAGDDTAARLPELVDKAIAATDLGTGKDKLAAVHLAGAWRAFHLLDAYGNGNAPRAAAVTLDVNADELHVAGDILAQLNHSLRTKFPITDPEAIARAQANADRAGSTVTPARLTETVLDAVRAALANPDLTRLVIESLPAEARAHAIMLHTMAYGLTALGPEQFVSWLLATASNLRGALPACPYQLTA